MDKIGIIGRATRAAAFGALGIDAYYASDEQEARDAFRKMRGYAVIYVTEEWYEAVRPQAEEYGDRMLPAVILLPERGSMAAELLEEAVVRAVGAQIA